MWKERTEKKKFEEGFAEEIKEIYAPVSYTHLDVYKRQEQQDSMPDFALCVKDAGIRNAERIIIL